MGGGQSTTGALRRHNSQAVLDVLLGGGARDAGALMAAISLPAVRALSQIIYPGLSELVLFATSGLVGQPRGEGGVSGGLLGADVDAPGVKVETDPGGVPAAQRQRGGGFGSGVKPHHL